MCYALFKCTQEIETLKNETKNFRTRNLFSAEEFEKSQSSFEMNVRDSIHKISNKYSFKLKNRRIPLRQILPTEIASILGIK